MNRTLIFLLIAKLMIGLAGLAQANQELVTTRVIEECVCETQKWQDVFDKSKHVAFGEVKEVTVHGETLASGVFTAMETFKGDGSHIHKIVGSAQKGDVCHNKMAPGFYIAYSTDSHTVVLNACSPSRQLSQDEIVATLKSHKQYAEVSASRSASELAQAQTPKPAPESAKEEDGFPVLIFVFAVLAMGLAVFFARKVLQRQEK